MLRKSLPSMSVLLAGALCCHAAFHEVPNDFSTIGEAIYYSGQGDTVLVHPGIYGERLILPGHDFLLVSEFYFTHDSSAIDSTIIDAGDFANQDTASVLTLVNGNSRATVISGFTLRGGHGMTGEGGGAIYINESHPTILSNIITENQAAHAVAIRAHYSHVRIAHNRIYGNCGQFEVICIAYQSDHEEMAIVEWNDISGNYGCWVPEWPYLAGPTVGVGHCGAAIRFNRFHDYCGNAQLGVNFRQAWGELLGNSFERLTYVHFEGTQDEAQIVNIGECYRNITLRDNFFRDCIVDGAAVEIWDLPLVVFERNWFENVRNIGFANAAAMYVHEARGTIRENVFIQCYGPIGAISLVWYTAPGCHAEIEENHFFANRSLWEGPEVSASAIDACGTGQFLCTVRENWFEGNYGTAIDLEHIPDPLDWHCSSNFWGNPSGPYHPTLNPEGRGDTVGDHILFDPWLTEPPTGSGVPSSPFSLSPQDWKLEGAFPNPFNESTRVQLISTRPQPFEITIYNLLGQRVRQLWSGIVPKDAPVSVTWDGRDERGQAVATGLYFIVANSRLSTSSQFKTCKVLCLR